MDDLIQKLNSARFSGMSPFTRERNEEAHLFPALMVSWTEA
jgi:hypothetical protein